MPCFVAVSAISLPSAGLPEYAYGMLLMKCGSSLLVYVPEKCGAFRT